MSRFITPSMCVAVLLGVAACDQAPPQAAGTVPVTSPAGMVDDGGAEASQAANGAAGMPTRGTAGMPFGNAAGMGDPNAQQVGAAGQDGMQQQGGIQQGGMQQGVAPMGAEPRDRMLAPPAFGAPGGAAPFDANQVNENYAVPGDPISDMDEPRGNSIGEMGSGTRSISSMSPGGTQQQSGNTQPGSEPNAQPPAQQQPGAQQPGGQPNAQPPAAPPMQ